MMWVGIESGHQFEIELIRHYEGIPSDEYQSLPKISAPLSVRFSSALDILRKEDHGAMYAPKYMLN